ncbi:Purine nucleoside phosphorylase [Trichuris trichiura]|uniref:purine-nucleoside phosphorylase n=1 Tax=Trichuris trichiura TaxID=36087 RepID=A0A077Z2P2_TRITR|nr:Purine nucleoside phosphorylase [Trichuris trichiura]
MQNFDVEKASAYVRERVPEKPAIAILSSTGHEELADQMDKCTTIKSSDIPGLPCPRTLGRQGGLLFGYLGKKLTVIMPIRLHSYEGFTPQQCTFQVRLLHALGVPKIFLSTVAGLLNKQYSIGDYMLVTDHLHMPSLLGRSALVGTTNRQTGAQRPVMRGMYSEELRKLFKKVVGRNDTKVRVHEGRYAFIGGPACPTPAELKFLRSAGADAVGMDAGDEAMVARQCGMEVIAVTTMGDPIGSHLQKTGADEVTKAIEESNMNLLGFTEQFILQL